MSNWFGVGRGGSKFAIFLLSPGVAIGGDAVKINNNTHLLVIMCVRISHKIGLPNLTNKTQFKKKTSKKQNTEHILI